MIAGLFPASVALYRSVGFELAGSYVERRFPAAHLAAIPGGGDVVGPARAARTTWPPCAAATTALPPSATVTSTGPRRSGGTSVPADLAGLHLYVVDGPDGGLAGYAIYRHGKGRPPYDYSIAVDEVMADEPDVSARPVAGGRAARAPRLPTST